MTAGQISSRILFHGRLADLFERDLEIATPRGCSIGDLRTRIAAQYPHAADALCNSRVRACVGDSIVHDNHRIAPGDQVEFLAPVSGG